MVHPYFAPGKPALRNLIGVFVIIFGLTIYAFVVAALGGLLAAWSDLLAIALYAVAGIVWIFPTKYLLAWMLAKKNAG